MTVPSGDAKRDNGGGCPSWCIADHGSQTVLEDQWHESSTTTVPVIEHWSHFVSSTWRLESEGLAFDLLIEQHVLSEEPWISFGPSDDRDRVFHLSPESVHRLVVAFEVLVKLITP